MDLYADNLSSLRRKQQDHRFSLTTTALLAIQTIRSVKEVHDRGYLHRDIKPVRVHSLNFRSTKCPKLFLLLDKKYCLLIKHLNCFWMVKSPIFLIAVFRAILY